MKKAAKLVTANIDQAARHAIVLGLALQPISTLEMDDGDYDQTGVIKAIIQPKMEPLLPNATKSLNNLNSPDDKEVGEAGDKLTAEEVSAENLPQLFNEREINVLANLSAKLS